MFCHLCSITLQLLISFLKLIDVFSQSFISFFLYLSKAPREMYFSVISSFLYILSNSDLILATPVSLYICSFYSFSNTACCALPSSVNNTAYPKCFFGRSLTSVQMSSRFIQSLILVVFYCCWMPFLLMNLFKYFLSYDINYVGFFCCCCFIFLFFYFFWEILMDHFPLLPYKFQQKSINNINWVYHLHVIIPRSVLIVSSTSSI